MRTRPAQPTRRFASFGLTLIELLVFVALMVCVLEGARIGQHVFGGKWGWLSGGFLGCFSFFLGALALLLLLELWFGGIPRLPRCRNGCCRGPGMFRGYGDYTLKKLGDHYCNVCGCGLLFRRRGRRFVSVSDDGTETPHLIWHPFRGWFPDDSGSLREDPEG